MSALDDAQFMKERLVDVFYDNYVDQLEEMRSYLIQWLNENVKTFEDLDSLKSYVDGVCKEINDFARRNYIKGVDMECCTTDQMKKFEDTLKEYMYLKEDIIAEVLDE